MHGLAPTQRLLMIDGADDCHPLVTFLKDAGWTVHDKTLGSASDADYDVGLIHLKADHFEHLHELEERFTRSNMRWIAVLSANDLRREKIGDFACRWFFDFHTLPFDVNRIQASLEKALIKVDPAPPASSTGPELLGESRPIRELRRLLSKLAPIDSPVLIRGERGAGKELIARSLHTQSQRRDKPFVVVDCAALAEHSIHAELFGDETGATHERSIGRIEAAHGGTLLLDEVGDLPLDTQADLLRFLEERKIERPGDTEPMAIDVRVVAATREDLETAVRKNVFARICTTN